MYLDIEIQKIILLYCENKNFIWKKKERISSYKNKIK